MTALALALVACCAMVCGTVLALARHRERMDAQTRSPDVTAVNRKVYLLDDAIGRQHKELAALRSEVDALNAYAAARSL